MSKQHDMKMKPSRWLCLLAASLLSSSTLAATPDPGMKMTGTSAADLGLSDYRHFIIYPHLEKALKAQKSNDEVTALREFQHAHEQAPDNIPLTLYLSEAYRHFGHNDRAQKALTEQLARHPQDARLQQALEAIPVEIMPVNTLEELLAQQQRCNAAPSTRCHSEVGQNALRLGNVQIAEQQLKAPDFITTPQGQSLLEDTLQRAIYLKQWQTADNLWALRHQQRTLTPAEQQAWFTVLLAGKMDERIETLQSQALFNTAAHQLTYASSLMQRKENQRLQRYLEHHTPTFNTAEEEKGWLYLLSRYSASPQKALTQFPARFAENRHYVVSATLPAILKGRDYTAAQALLSTLPQTEMVEERYAVSQALHNTHDTLRLAHQLYARNPSLKQLDMLTWQLIQAGQAKEAADLLLQRYPYKSSDASLSLALLARLVDLLHEHPTWATSTQLAQMSRPLPTAQQRDLQRQLPSIAHDCKTIRSLLGDMSAHYSADAWDQLADCYREDMPGMALYAYQQAERRSPSPYHKRSIAYQAYAVHDYASAMNAWQAMDPNALSDEDLMAAASTAQAAGNASARDHWLDEARKKGLDNSEQYWWLHAQRYLAKQPAQALSDLNQALHSTTHPSAQTYVSRAEVHRQLGHTQLAIEDLQRALALEPDNYDSLAALGYAYADNGEMLQSRYALEKVQRQSPAAIELNKQLTYINQYLGDMPRTQHHARLVVDSFDQSAQAKPLTLEQNQQRFDFRRIHEDAGRRWTFNLDSTIGASSGAISTTSSGSNSSPQRHRSYSQFEAEYRLGRNMLIDGDLLSAYGRLSTDTSNSGAVIPIEQPLLGAGLRWKPLRDQIFFLALEQQAPLDHDHGEYDTLIRASASFFNGGSFSDEWHPNGDGWFAQNLYLDAAEYMRHDMRAWTADYRFSRHEKVSANQTIEPYAHIQANGYRGQDHTTRGSQLGGIGVRWNIWAGETHYDAWPHKFSIGTEYQRTFKNVNQRTDKRNGIFITMGIHW